MNPHLFPKRSWFPPTRWMCEAPPLDELRTASSIRPRLALLLMPFYPKDPLGSLGKHVLTPSQALTSLAGATPPEWEVRLWDENLLQGPPPLDPLPAVVGITVHLTFARRAYALAAYYRRRGSKVILGGPHVLACPDEAAPHADALALGEGSGLWPRILKDVETGSLKARYDGSYLEPFDEAPPIRRHVLDRRAYLTTASLIATRGCRNRCGFCYLSTRGLRMPYQVRRPERVAREFAATGEPYGVFIDNNLGATPDYLRELCRALEPLEKIWSAAVTLDVTDDPALVREMARAGCTGVFIGLESLNDHNLADARKRTPLSADYARRVAIFQDCGIQVNGSFVFGFDHDDESVFERTVAWIERARLECATFHILTPYPGTPLFAQFEREDRLLHRDWSRYDTSHVVFRPRRMSPEALAAGYAWSYRQLFSLGSIWRRRPAGLGAAASYLGMSLLYKKMNWFWPLLIRSRMTHALWRPLVVAARLRHVHYRRTLGEADPLAAQASYPA